MFIFQQCLESFFRHLCVQFRTQSSTSCSWKGGTCRHPLSSLSLLYPSAGTERVGNARLHSLKPSLLFRCKITRAHICMLKLTMDNATSQLSWGSHCYPLLHILLCWSCLSSAYQPVKSKRYWLKPQVTGLKPSSKRQ